MRWIFCGSFTQSSILQLFCIAGDVSLRLVAMLSVRHFGLFGAPVWVILTPHILIGWRSSLCFLVGLPSACLLDVSKKRLTVLINTGLRWYCWITDILIGVSLVLLQHGTYNGLLESSIWNISSDLSNDDDGIYCGLWTVVTVGTDDAFVIVYWRLCRFCPPV